MKTIAIDEFVNLEMTTAFSSLTTEQEQKILRLCNGYNIEFKYGGLNKITIFGVEIKKIGDVVNIVNN